ncbi:MAG: hypothetical protein ABR498_04815 [Candidatus Dormibacteria bacterium]
MTEERHKTPTPTMVEAINDALDDAVLKEADLTTGAYVDRQLRLHGGETRLRLLIQSQWAEAPAIELQFDGVSRIEFDASRDVSPMQLENLATGTTRYRLLSIEVDALGLRTERLTSAALGMEAHLAKGEQPQPETWS